MGVVKKIMLLAYVLSYPSISYSQNELYTRQWVAADDSLTNLIIPPMLKETDEIFTIPLDRLFESNMNMLDYQEPREQQFAYLIDGNSTQWHYTDDNNIQITNLPYDDYTLKIEGRSGDDNGSTQELSLGIKMIRPFYLTRWFVTLLFMSLVITSFILIRLRARMIGMRQKILEVEELQNRDQQDRKHLPNIKNDEQENEFIIELRDYVLKNIDENNLNGDLLGRNVGMSRVHLHRKLKALTNQSTSEFIRSIRLHKAVEMIEEGKLNISEISDLTGFTSLSNFSRTFKKVYGKAPSHM